MRLNDFINSHKIRKELNLNDDTIMWTFDPLRFIYYTLSDKVVYHVVDPYMMLNQTKKYDRILSKKANLIVSTSINYQLYYQKEYSKKVLNIPHAISSEETQIDKNIVSILNKKYGKYIILVGTITEHVDISILEFIVENFNNNLLVLGKDKSGLIEKSDLRKNTNFYYLGIIHAKEIKNYIKASSICITSYKFNLNKGLGSGSLKFMNYLSQEKPIITTIDSEILELENMVIYKVENINELETLLNLGLKNELYVDKTAIKKYLSKNSYQNAISKILSRLN